MCDPLDPQQKMTNSNSEAGACSDAGASRGAPVPRAVAFGWPRAFEVMVTEHQISMNEQINYKHISSFQQQTDQFVKDEFMMR